MSAAMVSNYIYYELLWLVMKQLVKQPTKLLFVVRILN